MKLIFKISKSGTFYKFLDALENNNLRKDYKKKYGWSKSDEYYLNKFSNIKKNYKSSEIDDIFINKNTKNSEFYEIINHFSEIFEEYWLEYLPLLKRREKKIKESYVIKDNWLHSISEYFHTNTPNELIVLLVNNFSDKGGGSSNLPKKIILEPRKLGDGDENMINKDVFVLFHEICHKIITRELIKELIQVNDEELTDIIETLIDIVTCYHFFHTPERIFKSKIKFLTGWRKNFYAQILKDNLLNYTNYKMPELVNIILKKLKMVKKK